MPLAPLSAGFHSGPRLPRIKLGPSGADSRVGGFVYILAPCGSLQWTLLWGWEFLPLLPQPPQVFSISGLILYFPMLELRVASSVSLPICSSRFICTRMWDRPVRNLLPHWSCSLRLDSESYLPGCLSPSAPPTSLDECFFFNCLVVGFPYSLIFCQFWLFFVFKLFVVLVLAVPSLRGGTVCLPMPLSWPEVENNTFNCELETRGNWVQSSCCLSPLSQKAETGIGL